MSNTVGPIDQTERRSVYFKFKNEVPADEVFISAEVLVTLENGVDADPDAVTVGSPIIDDANKIVEQIVEGPGRAGCRYLLTCVAQGAAPKSLKYTIKAFLSVTE